MKEEGSKNTPRGVGGEVHSLFFPLSGGGGAGNHVKGGNRINLTVLDELV